MSNFIYRLAKLESEAIAYIKTKVKKEIIFTGDDLPYFYLGDNRYKIRKVYYSYDELTVEGFDSWGMNKIVLMDDFDADPICAIADYISRHVK